MTQPVEQLTQGTGLIGIVSAAASFGQHIVSMRPPPTIHSWKSTALLIMSAVGTTKENQFIEVAKTTTHGGESGMVVRIESPTVASTDIPLLNVLGQDFVTPRGLKRTSDITSIHTAIPLRKVPHGVSLIVVGGTGMKLDLKSAVPGAVFAHLQAGYVGQTASAPIATDSKSSIQSVAPREVKPSARENRSRVIAPIARAALRTALGPTRRRKRRTFAMCAED